MEGMPERPDPERELNFAREIIGQRGFRDVPTDEVLQEAERLLNGWMAGEYRMERPKLYDHYALLLLALLQKNRDLEGRIAALEGRNG
ncbi:hypothetical protein DEMA109039_20220 [Deinococcus marmoris]